ncbi:MAG: YbgC/FadM family acyl-CoA thioesterase [Myxococcota bacterium]
MKDHRHPVKIYLEDTDAQGIVYHANYLKYFERARTEILESMGGMPVALGERALRLVVHEVQLKFNRPAQLGDDLEIRSTSTRASSFRISFEQAVFRGDESKPLVAGTVHVVCINQAGELAELPDGFLAD